MEGSFTASTCKENEELDCECVIELMKFDGCASLFLMDFFMGLQGNAFIHVMEFLVVFEKNSLLILKCSQIVAGECFFSVFGS